MKRRTGPDGMRLFGRSIGLGVLFDEVGVPEARWARAPRQVSIVLTSACDLARPFCYAPKTPAVLDAGRLCAWIDELDAEGCLGIRPVARLHPTHPRHRPPVTRLPLRERRRGVPLLRTCLPAPRHRALVPGLLHRAPTRDVLGRRATAASTASDTSSPPSAPRSPLPASYAVRPGEAPRSGVNGTRAPVSGASWSWCARHLWALGVMNPSEGEPAQDVCFPFDRRPGRRREGASPALAGVRTGLHAGAGSMATACEASGRAGTGLRIPRGRADRRTVSLIVRAVVQDEDTALPGFAGGRTRVCCIAWGRSCSRVIITVTTTSAW